MTFDRRRYMRAYMRRRRSDEPTVRCRFCCRFCGDEIEACEGLFGEWMHSASRRERCDGHVAEPEVAA